MVIIELEAYSLGMEEEGGSGKGYSMIMTAEAYIRGYARHPTDRGIDDLMPNDARWMRAVKRLYAQLSPAEQGLMDSYADEGTTVNKLERSRKVKRLAQKLIILAGYESEYTMIYTPERGRNED